LFVGGRGSRFGFLAKGNLRHPTGVRLIERLAGVVSSALPSAPLVLVGRSEAYGDLGLPRLDDAPQGIGPLGGIRSLLAFAEEQGHSSAIALACDLPFLTERLVLRLAREEPEAVLLAPREGGLWGALTARYTCAIRPVVEAAVAAGEHSLQRVFARVGDGARELVVDELELRALVDWDSPKDVAS
jgi:molybdopterin-guanine dinucleotide biosynthesis protein A